jgi:N-acetylmuramoyl-L-alanine amidase
MRNIKYIVVHCTATPADQKIENIKWYWREIKKWKAPGYHYIIKKDGTVVRLQDEEKIANGVAGYNEVSVHISYIGGIDASGKPFDTRTKAQQESLFDMIMELSEKYPKAEILGHRDFPGVKKACPSFDVKTWLKGYIPPVITENHPEVPKEEDDYNAAA